MAAGLPRRSRQGAEPPLQLQLVVGLGNPGLRYVDTRHNVGFMVLQRLAAQQQASFRNRARLKGLLAERRDGEGQLRLLMPTTFMNRCGESVQATMGWFGLEPRHLLVVVDDMDLPLGRLRIRGAGSAGGHNGLRSVIQHLGTQAFARLRIGIGAPAANTAERRARTVGHVLGTFSAAEAPMLDQVLEQAVEGIHLIRRHNLATAMNRLNSSMVAAPSGPAFTV